MFEVCPVLEEKWFITDQSNELAASLSKAKTKATIVPTEIL